MTDSVPLAVPTTIACACCAPRAAAWGRLASEFLHAPRSVENPRLPHSHRTPTSIGDKALVQRLAQIFGDTAPEALASTP